MQAHRHFGQQRSPHRLELLTAAQVVLAHQHVDQLGVDAQLHRAACGCTSDGVSDHTLEGFAARSPVGHDPAQGTGRFDDRQLAGSHELAHGYRTRGQALGDRCHVRTSRHQQESIPTTQSFGEVGRHVTTE
jgi:hypothetical protein